MRLRLPSVTDGGLGNWFRLSGAIVNVMGRLTLQLMAAAARNRHLVCTSDNTNLLDINRSAIVGRLLRYFMV